MIKSENGTLQIEGTREEVFFELGAILYELCKKTSEDMGDFVTPDRLAIASVRHFIDKLESEVAEGTTNE